MVTLPPLLFLLILVHVHTSVFCPVVHIIIIIIIIIIITTTTTTTTIVYRLNHDLWALLQGMITNKEFNNDVSYSEWLRGYGCFLSSAISCEMCVTSDTLQP